MPARAKSAGADPDLATRFDLERTHIADEQSMMTWIRTSITLITFGFTIYKFFQLKLPSRAEKSRLVGPREFALTLVALGLIWLVMGTLDHRRWQRLLKQQWSDASRSLAVWLAAMISILGTTAFLLNDLSPVTRFPKEEIAMATKDQTHETGPWDAALQQIREWDPEWAENVQKNGCNPWTSTVLPRKTVELIGVALNAACTNLNPHGTRRHIRAALRAGASREEILMVLKMASVLAIALVQSRCAHSSRRGQGEPS